MKFSSISYDWFVITGINAQYKSVRTINGEGEYGFILIAIGGEKKINLIGSGLRSGIKTLIRLFYINN